VAQKITELGNMATLATRRRAGHIPLETRAKSEVCQLIRSYVCCSVFTADTLRPFIP